MKAVGLIVILATFLALAHGVSEDALSEELASESRGQLSQDEAVSVGAAGVVTGREGHAALEIQSVGGDADSDQAKTAHEAKTKQAEQVKQAKMAHEAKMKQAEQVKRAE